MKLEKFNYGKKRKFLLYGLLLGVGLIIGIGFNTSMAKYKVTQSIKLAEGKINYKPYDFKIMAMYQENDSGEYEEIDRMPSSGYVINEEKSYCTLDNKNKDMEARLYTDDRGKHIIDNLAYNDKCYLYFDIKRAYVKEQILANMPSKTMRTNFAQVLTVDTPGIIYKAQDGSGESYYFAGAASDNWVKFGKNKDGKDMYWRIIRINGDNTLRLIYEGTSTRANNVNSVSTQIGTSAFNASFNDNMYVGYMYTSGQVHGLGTDSTIKGVLDKWYDSNLAVNFGKYIDTNVGFCGDRQPSTSTSSINGSGGTGITTTYYGGYIRLITNKTPDFNCSDANDFYTSVSSNKGNKKLTRPIGLISADEVAYAGGVYGIGNSGYYLYTGQNYWTMSPYVYNSSGPYPAGVFTMDSNGDLGRGWLNSTNGVRPVINLKADTQFSQGNGTAENPYVIE